MKNKLLWMLISYTVILALLIASCSPTPPESKDEETALPETMTQEPALPKDEEETINQQETIVQETVDEAHIVFEFSKVDTEQRAVAFRSISFLNMDGQIMDELTLLFGTNDMDGLLEEGWLDIENIPDIGVVQWTGGPSYSSSMHLQIPDGTEGLLFEISSVTPGLLMDVTVGDSMTTNLRVDRYWHQAYVPVVEAVAEILPNTEPTWSEGHYFPNFPSTSERIYAFKVTSTFAARYAASWEPSWRINRNYHDMMALTLVGMQGIINRYGPRVYLDWNDAWGNHDFWLQEIESQIETTGMEVVRLEMDSMSVMNFLMRRYSDCFSGAVLYDPEVPDTINLATMFAGLEDRVILAPEQRDLPGMPQFDSIRDLRVLVEDQRWEATDDSRREIYQWVYDNLWMTDSTWLQENRHPPLERRIIGVISPGPPTSIEHAEIPGQFWPLGMASRDLMVALRLPAVYLSPVDEQDEALFARFLDDAPSPVPVTGIVALYEEETTALASRYGNWIAAISWPGGIITVSSLSLFSGLPIEVIRYQPDIDNNKILDTLGDSPVATMFCTDGDAIYYQMQRGFNESFGWTEVNDQNFGWTINPTMAELAPLVWNYYVKSTEGVSLISGLSGAGYAYPQLMDSDELDDYLEHTARYLDMTGLRVLRVDCRKGEWNEDLARHYYQNLYGHGYLGAIPGTGGITTDITFDYAGTLTPGAWPIYSIYGGNENDVVNHIMTSAQGGPFIDLSQGNLTRSDVCYMDEDPDAAGGEVAVIPPDFGVNEVGRIVVTAHNIGLLPGDYRVDFRMKILDNESSQPFARLYIGHSPADWHEIASMVISPSEFQQQDQYQDFSLYFSLDSYTTDIEARINYPMTSTALYVDSINITNTGRQELPVFSVALIVMMLLPSDFEYQSRAPENFKTTFENAGGIILTPNEYMAALNPEYMIQLASSIMGFEHPALSTAEQQLLNGDHLKSLLTVRSALRDYLESQ